MFKNLGCLSILALAAALLSSCSSTRFTSAWRDKEYQGPELHKLVVVGIVGETSVRRIFEDSLTKSLRGVGIEAVQSYTLLPDNTDQPIERLREFAEKIHAEGILTAHALRSDNKVEYTPGTTRIALPLNRYSNRPHFGSALVEDPRVHSYSVVTIRTDLWPTARDGKVLWSAVSETADPEDAVRASRELTALILSELRKEKLVPAASE
ncbi:hypothetical protein [Niveibacterium terrae]|uniref:hypothetical protein n=1 Tax=Niveibacterium terrae TaxID=3373598 RepID=UPI003A8E7E21